MLKRKAYNKLLAWKNLKTKQGLMVMGARQVGKTTLIREFAHNNYENVAEINFFDNKQAIETIAAAQNSKDLFLRISALSRTEILADKTLVFLDEIQECGDVLTWLKFLVENTQCDYIFSGSLLGLDSFDARSLPVGFLQTMNLYPLDFEEFCWADGISSSLIDLARKSFEQRIPVPDYLHEQLIDEFYRYLLVGGMPDAVQVFIDSIDLMRVRNVQRSIHTLYGQDIAKYVSDKTEARQIKMVYESIPGQLNSENKRFKYVRLGKNMRFANLETAFDWLASAGVALTTVKAGEPSFPLGLSEDRSSFKLYMNDVGILTSQFMGNVDLDILNKKSSINFGSVFENAAAQEFKAHGFDLFYYNSKRLGEIDFVLQDAMGGITLCEIKSGKEYRRHSALNNLMNTANYVFSNVYVFCERNVSVEHDVTYAPIYLMGFLDEETRGN